MPSELKASIAAVFERLLDIASHDTEFRRDLRTLALATITATRRQSRPCSDADGGDLAPAAIDEAAPDSGAPTVDGEPDCGPTWEPPGDDHPEPIELLPKLTLGGPVSTGDEGERPPATATSPSRAPVDDAELPEIEARCRLKAEGVRWAVTRRLLMAEGAEFRRDVAPRDREIHARAKDAECYLWMNVPGFRIPEPAMTDQLAACFEVLADAVALVWGIMAASQAEGELFEPSLQILAEAQSALRVAIDQTEELTDTDQVKVYAWLRETAARNRIFIARYLRLDDRADPSSLSGVKRRIETLRETLDLTCKQAKVRRSTMNRLRYHARLVAKGKGGIHDWKKIADTVDELVSDGVPPSNAELREIVIPILDDMPDLEDLPEGFSLALREMERYLASRTAAGEVAMVNVLTADVVKAAGLLNGTDVVLIGGHRRPGAHDALKSAFGLRELVWIPTKEHESVERFEPIVARPAVALVLLAIRWSSHSFGEVKQFCERHGKPLVRLPGGYDPNQVAAQILAQCSRHLERSHELRAQGEDPASDAG